MSSPGFEYLHHILDEANYILKESSTLKRDDFLRNETLQRAFVRSIEIIGEATKKLPDALKQKYTNVEWKAIAGMRDRLIHDYFGIDYEIVWDVVINKIPILQREIQQILNKEEK